MWCFTRQSRVAAYYSEVLWVCGVMGRPDQGNKAQTPVGYSHDTGDSTGGPVTAVTRVVPRVTPGVDGSAWGRAAAPPALQ